jgi:TonB family protein
VSTSRTARRGWAGLAAIILFAGPAAAEEAAHASASRTTRFDQWVSAEAARLQLDGDQVLALKAYATGADARPKGDAALSADQFHALTAKQRFAYLIQHIEADLAAARAQEATFERFYAVLSADQRARFDAETTSEKTRPALAAAETPQPAPELPDYSLPSHVDADWLVRPSAEDVARVYPSAALKAQVSGRVDLSCVADENGYLTDCIVNSDTPPGQGFGNAALEITAYFRMRPATNYGIPTRSTVRVPINFKMEK